jgi:nucleotide-binding universal stress UspA family protein
MRATNEAGVAVQHAMHLAAHSDAKVHARYVMSTKAMRTTPDAALPRLPGDGLPERHVRDDSTSVGASDGPGIVTARDDSPSLPPDPRRKLERFQWAQQGSNLRLRPCERSRW